MKPTCQMDVLLLWLQKENLARLEGSTTVTAAAATETVGSGGAPATSVGPLAPAGARARPAPPPVGVSVMWARLEECTCGALALPTVDILLLVCTGVQKED